MPLKEKYLDTLTRKILHIIYPYKGNTYRLPLQGQYILHILPVPCNSQGMSEKLELVEMYDQIQEERLDHLQDELVTCIAGEEGQGGNPVGGGGGFRKGRGK